MDTRFFKAFLSVSVIAALCLGIMLCFSACKNTEDSSDVTAKPETTEVPSDLHSEFTREYNRNRKESAKSGFEIIKTDNGYDVVAYGMKYFPQEDFDYPEAKEKIRFIYDACKEDEMFAMTLSSPPGLFMLQYDHLKRSLDEMQLVNIFIPDINEKSDAEGVSVSGHGDEFGNICRLKHERYGNIDDVNYEYVMTVATEDDIVCGAMYNDKMKAVTDEYAGLHKYFSENEPKVMKTDSGRECVVRDEMIVYESTGKSTYRLDTYTVKDGVEYGLLINYQKEEDRATAEKLLNEWLELF